MEYPLLNRNMYQLWVSHRFFLNQTPTAICPSWRLSGSNQWPENG